MEQTVYPFIEQHKLIHTGATVLVGVSGGPDSMALLHLYKQLREEWNLRIIAVAVDHQLRGEQSREDIRFVQHQCANWNIPCVETCIEVAAYKKEAKVSTQVASRTLRYQFFKEQMNTYQADYLALGHHGDDQVETMAMSLVHHSNTRSLAGIPVKRTFASGNIVRPFLSISKEEIYTYCKLHEISFRVDPSNEDDSYERNYFRKHIIPVFTKQNPNVHKTIQHLSERLNEDEKYLEEETKKLIKRLVSFKKDSRKAIFNRTDFLAFPIALQRRAFHLVLDYLFEQKIEGITYAHEQAFIALCNNKKAYVQSDLPNGCTIVKQYDEIKLYQKTGNEVDSYMYELPIPGKITLPNGDQLSTSYTDKPHEPESYVYMCNEQDVHLPLFVRTRRNGDRMSWKGLTGTKKLKNLFIDEKIPRHKRNEWPIVTDKQDRILWVVGIRKSHTEIERSNERTYIAIHYEEAPDEFQNLTSE